MTYDELEGPPGDPIILQGEQPLLDCQETLGGRQTPKLRSSLIFIGCRTAKETPRHHDVFDTPLCRTKWRRWQ